jgi:hypothetical protein
MSRPPAVVELGEQDARLREEAAKRPEHPLAHHRGQHDLPVIVSASARRVSASAGPRARRTLRP